MDEFIFWVIFALLLAKFGIQIVPFLILVLILAMLLKWIIVEFLS